MAPIHITGYLVLCLITFITFAVSSEGEKLPWRWVLLVTVLWPVFYLSVLFTKVVEWGQEAWDAVVKGREW